VTINFCVNTECISTGLKKYQQEGADINPFDGVIWVPSFIAKSSVSHVKGLEFVGLDPSNKIATIHQR
jgi:hypothetical protein